MWIVLLIVLAMALAYIAADRDLESDIGALLGLQFGAAPTPAPSISFVADTPSPTATPTPLVPSPSALPVPTLAPTQEPLPTPTPRPTATPVPLPTPTPPEYSIDDVNVKLSTTVDATTTVDFTVSIRKVGAGPDTSAQELFIAVDGDEAEMVAIIPGLTSRDAETFVFSREFSPGEYVVTIAIEDAAVEVPVEVPGNTTQPVPPSATPEAVALIVSSTPAPTEVPTVTPTLTAQPTITPTPTRSPVVARQPDPTFTPEPSLTPTPVQPTMVPTIQVSGTLPTPSKTPTLRYPGDSPLDMDEVESWVVHLTNQERDNAGLTPFIHDPAISQIARSHSENMVKFGYGHTVQGSDPTDRALAAGYNCRAYRSDGSYTYGLSENIAKYHRVTQWSGIGSAGGKVTWRPSNFHIDSQAIAQALVDGWMNSPGHRANILESRARRIGVGVAIVESTKTGWIEETIFATQNFSECS